MGKLSVAVMLTLAAMSLSSCSIFGFEETSVPVIASHSGEDTIDESNSRFYELSKPEKEESKPFRMTNYLPASFHWERTNCRKKPPWRSPSRWNDIHIKSLWSTAFPKGRFRISCLNLPT